MAREWITQGFNKGTHNTLNAELIPQDAAQGAQNWLSFDDHIELSRGRTLVGSQGTAGKTTGLHVGYRVDGTAVFFRKVGTAIQYFNGTSWVNVITSLTSTADYTFTNYASLAGAFVYIGGVDGLFKIVTANPANFASLFQSGVNYKGKITIDKGRMFLWNRVEDKTGLYGSAIDAQNSTTYTTVAGEATTSLGGTLAFKAGGARRTCFGVTITLTGSGEVYTDNFNGVLTGTLGGTGTINYMTGAYTLSNAGVGTAGYQYEDSNLNGVTDFAFSSPRVAAEGFIIRQDIGGDAILAVKVFEGDYFSLKEKSCYRLTIPVDDLSFINEVYRSDIGVPSFKAAVSTGRGIVFMNTANPDKPRLTILQKNITGDNLEPLDLTPHFKMSDFVWTDCVVETWGEWIVVAGRTSSVDSNNRLLLVNTRIEGNPVDVTHYQATNIVKNAGHLYLGDSISETVSEVFSGFDDNEFTVENEWKSKEERFGTERLKRVKWLRIKGQISVAQSLQVYESLDGDAFTLIGTVLGSGDYVDLSQAHVIGATMIGQAEAGGGGDGTIAYDYFTYFKLSTGKFRKRAIRLKSTGLGYISVNYLNDYDIWLFQEKLPSRLRVKQNRSLDGSEAGLTWDTIDPDWDGVEYEWAEA